jgi:nicotinate-nucleotide adenylyltransferase
MKIGVFGGTFDPIHLGHLDVARAARAALALDAVWLVPAHLPPHRAAPRASAAHRFAMVALALQRVEGIVASDLEMETAGPSYTIDTLDRLCTRGWDRSALFFVTGADAFRDIATWKAYPDLLDRSHFAVVSRPGVPAPALRRQMPGLSARMIDAPGPIPSTPSIVLIDAPTAAVSSTRIRQAMADGRSVAGAVPAAVLAYIARQGLYASSPASTPEPERTA